MFSKINNIFFVFQSMVLDECTRLVADSSEKSSVKIEELNSEIRKLKAMIGKNDIKYLIMLIYIIYIFSETRDKNPDSWDEEQGAGEDVDKQRDHDQQQRTQRLGSGWSLRWSGAWWK